MLKLGVGNVAEQTATLSLPASTPHTLLFYSAESDLGNAWPTLSLRQDVAELNVLPCCTRHGIRPLHLFRFRTNFWNYELISTFW